jgi:hypothetical protein
MPRFVPPSIEELRAYAREIGFAGFDAQRFLDRYETVGWVVGRARTPMVSWKAAVRTWQRNQAEWGGPSPAGAVPSVPDRTADALGKILEAARWTASADKSDLPRFWQAARDKYGERLAAEARRLFEA